MGHLALEVFDRTGTGSQYATLPENATITITDTSEIFGSGNVWSWEFSLNVHVNARLFGTSGDLHGSRLHEQVNKRRARLWVDGLPLYIGYLKLDDEVDVDADGNVSVKFESGQKTFDEQIEGTKAREVSVGDVVIGVALNRKRVSDIHHLNGNFTLNGLSGYVAKDNRLKGVDTYSFSFDEINAEKTPYVQRWPKLVKSHGDILGSNFEPISPTPDYTNVQIPYDGTPEHSFCNINICYPLKVNDKGEEKEVRGYTVRLARGNGTTDGGDNQTRFNNSPNFYLLYFIDRLFKDLGIHIKENQAKDVEDLRRVFMLNYGCHYEEIEDYDSDSVEWKTSHTTPTALLSRYGQYYFRIINSGERGYLSRIWTDAGQHTYGSRGVDQDHQGKVLLRDIEIQDSQGETLLEAGSVEGFVNEVKKGNSTDQLDLISTMTLDTTPQEQSNNAYSAYLAYATGENYPDVDINDIISAMKSMFGVRLIFDNDYRTVRIVLLRNIFRSQEVQDIDCDIEDNDERIENSIRGFRMTYGKGKDNTSYYYKGFNDLFPRASKAWKDTTDKHDYSQWKLDADYDFVKQSVSAFNKTCYVTPVNGNAWGTQVDEEEDVLFPSLFEWAGYMDAEDGDCTGDDETIEEVQCGASPVLMSDVNGTYASLFSGDMKAPAPDRDGAIGYDEYWDSINFLSTYGMVTLDSLQFDRSFFDGTTMSSFLYISGKLDIFISEGFRLRLLDNYSVSNGGTPFDEASPGLQFGIMRGSGNDAYVRVFDDPDDDENNAWEVIPGSGAVSYPDTCDNHGELWTYGQESKIHIDSTASALSALSELFPNSNAPFYKSGFGGGYITHANLASVPDDNGVERKFLIVEKYGSYSVDYGQNYISSWAWKSVNEILAMDAAGQQIIVEANSSRERLDTLMKLSNIAKDPAGKSTTITIDQGVDSRFGRFSLKLRAEKPNPYYVEGSSDSDEQGQYLEITDPNLRQRGLADQFYKEYSFWVRNARIVKRTVRMELAQLLAIDKTKRVRVGDVMGFIRKMQYTVSNKTGLGNVTMEIMYI